MWGGERTDLEQMRRPLDFQVRSDLDPLLSVLQLLPVEVDITQVEDGGQHLEDSLPLLAGESEDLEIQHSIDIELFIVMCLLSLHLLIMSVYFL